MALYRFCIYFIYFPLLHICCYSSDHSTKIALECVYVMNISSQWTIMILLNYGLVTMLSIFDDISVVSEDEVMRKGYSC